MLLAYMITILSYMQVSAYCLLPTKGIHTTFVAYKWLDRSLDLDSNTHTQLSK